MCLILEQIELIPDKYWHKIQHSSSFEGKDTVTGKEKAMERVYGVLDMIDA